MEKTVEKIKKVLQTINVEGENIKRSHLEIEIHQRKDIYLTSLFSLDDIIEFSKIKGLLTESNGIISLTRMGKGFLSQ